jgi:hypothetical protein
VGLVCLSSIHPYRPTVMLMTRKILTQQLHSSRKLLPWIFVTLLLSLASVQYPLPHLQPPPVLTPMQQPPHFAPSAVFPFTYPHQVAYPHQPVAPAALPMAPYFHHWAACPAPALLSAKHPKPQREFCCQPYLDYFRHTKPFLGSKSGWPPHSPSCHKAKKQKQKQS